MGKIRIKTIGTPEQEDAQKEKAKRRREGKKQKKLKTKTRAPGLKGGERIVAVGPTPEEIEAMELPASPDASQDEPKKTKESKTKKKSESKDSKSPKKHSRSKRYITSAKLIDQDKAYPLKKAISLLRQVSLSRFNASVEAHLNVKDQKLSGEIPLPHGSGKKLKIVIADDKLLKQLEKGKIDCDILLAKPKIMPQLAKFGKLLGPKGLMPNPKNGTLTNDPEKKAKELSKGKIQYKTEKQAPIIHLVFGKMDFKNTQLIENFQAIINTIGPTKIKKAVIKSSMSPGIKVAL